MTDDTYKIYCLLERDGSIFDVEPSMKGEIGDLKNSIQRALLHVSVIDLILWKLHNPIPIRPFETFPNRLPPQGSRLSQYAVELRDPTQELEGIFPQRSPPHHLSIIVRVSHTPSETSLQHRIGSPPPSPPPDAIKRDTTVSALYSKLNRYHFIQVRGTPASGKSTLAKLLGEHIHLREPHVHVIWVSGWKLNDVEACGGWNPYLKTRKFWDEDKDAVFIFDEAQISYADSALWNDFFKGMRDYSKRRAIAFASYGSPSSVIGIEGAPVFVADEARVTLLPIDHKDDLPAVGLFFTQTEFNELVSRQYSPSEHYFDPSFLNTIFEITQGHVGAIHDVLAIILGYDSYRQLKNTDERYTWELFQRTVNLSAFLKHFEHPDAGVFRRGLPSDRDLKVVALAGVFSSVLQTGYVTDANFSGDTRALHQCFRNGWLHSDKLNDSEIAYFFPTSLHRWYVEWKLLGMDTIPFDATNILQFVVDVISSFSPRMLSSLRRIGPGCVQRPPEAHYQDEFYRCCHIRSNGSLRTFPEFDMAKGRVDFYIPAKEWGVELLRDGDNLREHSGRFSSRGPYGSTLRLSDYIILDCRTTLPRVPHPNFPKLYHAVFSDNYRRVQILDNTLQVVPEGEFMLLASS